MGRSLVWRDSFEAGMQRSRVRYEYLSSLKKGMRRPRERYGWSSESIQAHRGWVLVQKCGSRS